MSKGLFGLHGLSTNKSIMTKVKARQHVKGIVHLNIIFSYLKVNKICNLDHPVY